MALEEERKAVDRFGLIRQQCVIVVIGKRRRDRRERGTDTSVSSVGGRERGLSEDGWVEKKEKESMGRVR